MLTETRTGSKAPRILRASGQWAHPAHLLGRPHDHRAVRLRGPERPAELAHDLVAALAGGVQVDRLPDQRHAVAVAAAVATVAERADAGTDEGRLDRRGGHAQAAEAARWEVQRDG